MLTKTIVYDLDGTLSDCRWRLCKLKSAPKDWDGFNALAKYDRPVPAMLDRLLRDYALGYMVVLLTGRKERYRDLTLEWLGRNAIPFDCLTMRPNFHQAPQAAFKLGEIRKMKDQGLDVQMVYDDNESVRLTLREHGFIALKPDGHEEDR
jgi:phosphoglycolate phosphatase-like HAD superfamily hydrolase